MKGVVMKKKVYINEHKKLTKLLDETAKKLKHESNEQKAEVKKKIKKPLSKN